MKLPISFRYFVGSGPGGQHRNRTESCVEASVELPDGTILTAVGQTQKSQYQNKKIAKRLLAVKVQQWFDMENTNQKEISNERIRTYHQPRNTVTDHASGEKLSYDEVVLKGNLGPMIDARRKHLLENM